MKTVLKYSERLLFYGMLVLSIAFIIHMRYNPSLDGPAHLYNSRLLNYLIAGNPLVSTFHAINKVPVPNLTDHVLLALFITFLSSAASVKLLLILYIAAFSLGFRAIIRLLRPENIGLSAFAIPLAHSFLLYIGFYNFCISAALMLWAIYYYLKHFNTLAASYNPLRFGIMLLLIIGVYFTNGLAFLLLGLLIALLELQVLLPYLKANAYKQSKATINRHIIQLLLLWLPGIACFVIFILSTRLTSGGSAASPARLSELVKDIVTIRPLTVYMHEETTYTSILFYVILFLFGTSVIRQIRQNKSEKTPYSFAAAVIAILTLLLYFTVPNNASVGMMTVRFCYYFFLFLVLWLALRKNYSAVIWVALPVIYFLHCFLLFTMHAPVIKDLDRVASEIVESSEYISPNSVVLPVNCSSNWLMLHFTDYDGLKKTVINTDDYESNVGWFPLIWNKAMPNFSLHGKTAIPNALITFNTQQKATREIDYIFVFGDISWVMQHKEYEELKEDIKNYCKPVFVSQDGFIHLYSVNH